MIKVVGKVKWQIYGLKFYLQVQYFVSNRCHDFRDQFYKFSKWRKSKNTNDRVSEGSQIIGDKKWDGY